MAKYLPPYPSLESLHNQAKQLLKAHRSSHPAAQQRVLAHHPRYASQSPPGPLRLSDAQLVIAREYGFDSWPKLKHRVDALNALPTAVAVGDADGLSPAWLTERLHLRGHLPQGSVVAIRREATQPRKDGVHRLHLSYSPEAPSTLPATFIYKYNTKGRNRAHPSGTREAFFYRVLVPQMPRFPVAACFDMGLNEAAGQSYLLLEDLEATHFSPPASDDSPYGGWLSFQGVATEQFAAVARQLARFQARWWDRRIIDREPLAAPAPGLGSLNDAANPAEVPGILQALDAVAPDLDAATQAAARRSIEAFPALYQARMEKGQHRTLIHVDFHLRSVFLPRDPQHHEVAIIDWETVQRSIGVADIAHLMVSSMLPVPMRRAYESQVLEAYHAELQSQGVRAYSLEDCRADYRLALVGLMAVIAPPFLRACRAAWGDWQCEGLLG